MGSLTEESSTSTTTPTTLMDMSPKSLTMALLPSPLLSLVLDMASLTVVLSDMELPTSAKPFVNDFQDTRDTTPDDRQRRHTDKILDNIFPISIYLLINMNTSRQ